MFYRRSVQTILINQNIIKWLISLLSKTDRLSDYTLGTSIGVSHPPHFDVRFRICRGLADESLFENERPSKMRRNRRSSDRHAVRLAHPSESRGNDDERRRTFALEFPLQTRPYVNSSLYSILTLKSVRDKAMQLVSSSRIETTKRFFLSR